MALASASEMEEGSLRKEEAVLKAACFSAQVVPVDGGGDEAGGGGAVVERLEKRDESPEREEVWVVSFVPVAVEDSFAHGFVAACVEEELPPMPNPGTFTPAEPSLLNAPSWLAKTLCLAGGGGG